MNLSTGLTETAVWDPSDPGWASDPYGLYARLREANPTHRSPQGFWVFTRYADCVSILRDRRAGTDFRARSDRSNDRRAVGGARDGSLDELIPFIFRDPPDHTRLRSLVQKAFTPRVIGELAPRIEQICAELIDDMLGRSTVDLVSDYAYPLPIRIITEMLGVPPSDRGNFQEWTAAVARGLDPEFLLPPEALTERTTGMLAFIEYFADLIAVRRDHPGDDLISLLIQANENGESLTHAELIATCLLLLIAGHETTVSLISGGAWTLMQHPDALARLRDEPEVAAIGIEEILRYVSPVQLTTRVATSEMLFGAITVKPGDTCLLLIGAANRDPAVFTDPETFRIDRTPNPHLGFGLGIHHCLGAPLARLEAQIALRALARRTRASSAGDVTYKDTVALRGLATLPINLTAV